MSIRRSFGVAEEKDVYNKDELVKALVAALQVHAEEDHELIKLAIEKHMNSEQHAYLNMLMEREARRQEIWERVKGNLLLWFLIAICGGVATAVWHWVKHAIKFT